MAWLEAARRIVQHGPEVQLADGSWRPWDAYDYPDEHEEAHGAPFPGERPKNFPPDGAVMLDAFTASMLVQVHDALSPAHAELFAAMPLVRAADVGWRLVAKPA